VSRQCHKHFCALCIAKHHTGTDIVTSTKLQGQLYGDTQLIA
jgi:hypothetical protein